MQIISRPDELGASRGGAFVPTMGALHEGHLALVRRAAQCPAPVVMSIFVNPTQFGPNEDYQRYPRPLEADLAAAEEAGAEIVFVPEVETIYPPGEEIPIPPLAEVATRPGLEDAHRPGHLAGVCQVVARLFDLLLPRFALFGEKDYQQLLVIRAMTEKEGHRWRDLQIIPHETVREDDGLAMSSRNVHLAPEQRERALGLFRALLAARGADNPPQAEEVMGQTLDEHGLEIDYAVARDAATLLPTDSFARPTRGLIAARIGDVRLIDNMPIGA